MYQYRYKSIITYNNTLCLPCYRRENTEWLSLWTVPRGSGRRWSHCWATWLRVRPPTLTWSSCSPSYSAWWRNTPPFWWAVYSKQCCGYEFYLECRFWILPTLVEHFWKFKKTCNQLKRRIYQLYVCHFHFHATVLKYYLQFRIHRPIICNGNLFYLLFLSCWIRKTGKGTKISGSRKSFGPGRIRIYIIAATLDWSSLLFLPGAVSAQIIFLELK